MKKIIDQSFIRDLVKNHISDIKRKNPLYSMRAFAKKMGISVGGVSSFLSGKSDYSVEMLERIVSSIVSSPEERKHILKEYNVLLVDQLRERTKSSNYSYRILNDDEMSFIKDWYHYAILFLTKTKDFRLDILWISKRLGISSEEVESALSRLLHLKLIVINDDQTITLTENYVKTSDDIASQTIRIMHKQMLYLASEAIDKVPVELRDITSLTVPVDLKKLPKAKEIIRKCQDDLMAILSGDDMTDVYHVLFSLYPVTKKGPSVEGP